MQAAGTDDPGDRTRRPLPRAVSGVLGGLAIAVVAVLALRVTQDVHDRRRHGFCRPDHGIAGATNSQERTWWPIGDRCQLRMADGSVVVRQPGWALTGLAASWSAVVLAGALAPVGSVRRKTGWVAVVPAVPVAVLVVATVQPPSLARVVCLTTVAVGFGSIMGAATGVALWLLLRGRLLATMLCSWLAWATLVFLQGRDAIGP